MTDPVPGDLYLRVSDMDVDPNASDPEADLQKKIQHQEDWGRREATALGVRIVRVYKERHTGTVKDRPEMNRLKSEIPELGVKIVLVYSDDRLARDDIVARDLVREIEALGATVHFGNISFEGMLPKDRKLMFGIKVLITAWERDTIVDRLSRGAKYAKSEGTLFYKVPNHFRQDDRGIIRPDDDALDMHARRERGESANTIAESHETYRLDVDRTVERVRKWKALPPGVVWKRGKKVLRALRENNN